MLNILETTRLVCGLIFYAHFAVRGCGGFECHAAYGCVMTPEMLHIAERKMRIKVLGDCRVELIC